MRGQWTYLLGDRSEVGRTVCKTCRDYRKGRILYTKWKKNKKATKWPKKTSKLQLTWSRWCRPSGTRPFVILKNISHEDQITGWRCLRGVELGVLLLGLLKTEIFQFDGRWDEANIFALFHKTANPPIIVILLLKEDEKLIGLKYRQQSIAVLILRSKQMLNLYGNSWMNL